MNDRELKWKDVAGFINSRCGKMSRCCEHGSEPSSPIKGIIYSLAVLRIRRSSHSSGG
jgi:hypothetical protein